MRDSLRDRLSDAPFWQRRLDGVARGDAALHLAVFREPFLSLLLSGKKTIESRFSVNRVAPFRAIEAADLLLLKKSSGPVLGVALVGAPGFYELDPKTWSDIRRRFASAICADGDEFWEARARARFATLIPIEATLAFEPFCVEKRDRRGWVVIATSGAEQARAWA